MPWFDYVEKKNIHDQGGISGSTSIFDQLPQQGIARRVYSYHHLKDAEILDQAVKDIQSKVASFFFLDLIQLDMFLHMYRKEHEEVEKRLQSYEGGLT